MVWQSFWKVEKEFAMRQRENNRVMGKPLIKFDNNLTKFDIVSGYENRVYLFYRLMMLNYWMKF